MYHLRYQHLSVRLPKHSSTTSLWNVNTSTLEDGSLFFRHIASNTMYPFLLLHYWLAYLISNPEPESYFKVTGKKLISGRPRLFIDV